MRESHSSSRMPLKRGLHASVADLLNSTTFLESLSPHERTDIISAARHTSLPASPVTKQVLASHEQWSGRRHPLQQLQDPELDLSSQSPRRPATAETTTPAARQAHAAIELLQEHHATVEIVAAVENEQLQREKKLLQKQKLQLQAKITSLQYQVSMLLANQKAAEVQSNERLAALETVITRLQATMSEVGATASRVAQENKALLLENQQLTADRVKHLELIQQLKAHSRQLETDMLAKVSAANQQAAEAAAAAASPLNALITPAMLAATAPPPGSDSSNLSSLLDGAAKIGPALQDIAMLKRARRTLQKQVAQLQQQLSAAEAESQAAGANSAAERARAGKALAKAQQQLAAALQRLQHMADREQQQQLAMQERESYIAKLEQCLLDQHQQLTQKTAAAFASSPARSRSVSTGKQRGRTGAERLASAEMTLSNTLFPVDSPGHRRRPAHQQQGPEHASMLNEDATVEAAAGRYCAVVAADGGLQPDSAAATSDAAELLQQHHKRLGVPAQAGRPSSSPAAVIGVAQASTAATAADSPDVNAVKRAAMAKRCINVMLTGSPEGRLAPQAAEAQASAAQQEQQQLPTQPDLQQQQALSGLQQLQQSRLQQWHQRQLRHQQQAKQTRSADSSFGNARSKTSAAGTLTAGITGRQQHELPSFGSVLPQQRERQRRLRELLQQKQQRARSQQPTLRAAKAPLQQHQALPLRQQRHQQQHQLGKQEIAAQAEWEHLQQQAADIAVESGKLNDCCSKPVMQGRVQRHAADCSSADDEQAAVQEPSPQQSTEAHSMLELHLQLQLQEQQQQQLKELLQEECTEEELSMFEMANECSRQQQGKATSSAVACGARGLVSEDQLVAQVVEMQHNLQLLEGQLLQLGCSR